MSYDNLLTERSNGVLRITVNRPDKLNALNRATLQELDRAVGEAKADDEVRVVVVAGAGDKAFVAGADIGEISELSPVQAREMSALGQGVFNRLERLGKPSIAVLDGFALGGGLELAMACTLRVASDKAKLGQPEINLGIIPGFGGTQRLARLAGKGAALELCLTGEPISAQRAHELGLVTRVVAPEAVADEVDALAGNLAAAAPQALRAIIDAIDRGSETALEQGLAYESQLFAVCCATEDMREGTRAFMEKRKPTFKGH